jgi:NAD(P)-dependent dehydrogenase (short-subunit alcohol dehydrogenase family)
VPDSLSDNRYSLGGQAIRETEKDVIMHDSSVALVTGANKGIGLQIANDLAAHGLTVVLGSRDFDNGKTAAASIDGDARAVQLDVTDQSSIAAAAE